LAVSQRWSNGLVWAATILLVVGVSKEAWAGQAVNGTSILNMLVFALPLAGIYAIAATGLVVVYTTTGIFNFAQGAIGMFLAYVDWELSVNRGMPQWLAIPLVVLVIAPLLGVFLDRAIMRHLQDKPLVVQLMVTVGLLFAFIGVANMIWNQNDAHSLQFLFGERGFHIGDVILTYHRFITLVLAILLAIGLRILLFGTRTGIAMRAVVDNRELAALEGARSARLSSFAWAIGCSLAALAGILYAPETGDMKTSGPLTFVIITAFAAAVVGRLRSLPMTYVGALILALVTSYVSQFLTFTAAWTNVEIALPTIMLFIVLLLLPRARLEFSRINPVKRVEPVSTVRDTVIGMAVLIAAMAIVSQFLSVTNLDRFSLGMATALVALSLVPLTGWAGQVSLAPLAFAGIGAVVYAHLGGAHGSIWAVFLAGIITAPIGALLALPALRLRGLYLALATLAFAYLVDAVFYTQTWAVGDNRKFVERLKLGPVDTASPRAFLMLVTVVFAIMGIGVVALRRRSFGRRLIALRDSEAASVTVGVNVLETKAAVFALSAGMAGFAGAFMLQRYGSIGSGQDNPFTVLLGLGIVLALVIGGVSFVSGALFAGMFGLATVLIQENWHLSLWQSIEVLAPGLAVLGIIQNPSGAVVPIGEGFARLLPWRHDARRDYEEMKAATSEPEVGELGLARDFEEADVLLVDRTLGISNDVPRPAAVPTPGA
jgi:branched-subunit amino acid ABC-type transport system permease component